MGLGGMQSVWCRVRGCEGCGGCGGSSVFSEVCGRRGGVLRVPLGWGVEGRELCSPHYQGQYHQ